jgi:hypothetical protein
MPLLEASVGKGMEQEPDYFEPVENTLLMN